MATGDANLLLEAAARIGDRLVAAALWDGDACTWSVTVPGPRVRTTVSAVAEGDVYQGSAGIALFLAELWGETGDPRALACARGAVRHSEVCRTRRGVARIGFHSGDVGPAYVAARLAALTNDDEWIGITERQLSGLEARIEHDRGLDIIGGASGAILGLLKLDAAIGMERARSLALRMGAHLEKCAVRRSYGWSWHGGGGVAKQNLCGYAHGASGFAHAFLELFAHTGDRRWRFAAVRAIEYERCHALPPGGDWPDLRNIPLSEMLRQPGGVDALRTRLRLGDHPPVQETTMMRAWCHGAPGIALTRIRAVSLGVDADACEREASAALAVTLKDLEHSPARNYSLCHGSFGNAESLVIAAERLGSYSAEYVASLALDAVHRFDLSGRSWTTGVPGGGPDPSLMVGEAGIGHFLLRLARRNVPSVLCLSGWEPSPAVAADDADLRGAEAARLLKHLSPAIRGLEGADVLRERITSACAAAPTVEAVIDAVTATITAAGHDPAAERLRDALALDLARLHEELAFDDFLEQFVRELRRPPPSDAAWAAARWVLQPFTRIVRTRWAWSEWLACGGSAPAEEQNCFVLYRSGRSVRLQQVTPVAALVLETLRTPRTLAGAIDASLLQVEPDPIASAAMPGFVEAMIRNAVAAGIIEICEECTSR